MGFEHQFVIAGTAPFEQRQKVKSELTEISSVVNVRNMMTTEVNIAAKIVTATRKETERSLERLQSKNLAIDRIEILESEQHQPTNMLDAYVRNDE